jgi:hypothetical protein
MNAMNGRCMLLEKCGFFIKYQKTKEKECRGFINSFCNGIKQNECKRRIYWHKQGVLPSDDMMPTGQMIAHASCYL